MERCGVTSIGIMAFNVYESLTSVYYKGTVVEWNAITIDWNNDKLGSTTRYYYSETEPTTDVNY